MTRALAADVASVAALLWWATWFTWGSGGQDRHLLGIASGLLALALVLVKPWTIVPARVTGLLCAVGACAFTVAVTAPTGLRGANEAGAYTFAALVALLILGWARDEGRRLAVAGVVVVAGLLEFAQGFVQWWASGYADKVFVGTFFWHNQTGIFLVMGVGMALPLLAARVQPLTALAWITVPLCSAGVIFTTSRGSQMALAAVFVASAALALLRSVSRGASVLRIAAAGGLAVAASRLLTGPPFFATRVAATLGAGSRHEDLTANGQHRLEFWGQAFRIFERWPLSGAGFHSFGAAARLTSPHRTVGSAFAHNGFLQLLSDGGLLLAVPVLAALALAVLLSAQGSPSALRQRDVVTPAALVTLVVLLLHSGMDFDWSYPSLLTGTAVVGALAVPPRRPQRSVILSGSLVWACVCLTLLLLTAIAGWGGGNLINLPLAGGS